MKKCLIVGAGLFGSTLANLLKEKFEVVVIDKRDHKGGNCYSTNVNGIEKHVYGPHIFHTDNEEVWKFINQHCTMNNFINSPIAVYKRKLFNLPFNMNTFYQLWGVASPSSARAIIETQKLKNVTPSNLEEQALSLVGTDIYKKLIKGYTEKQWGKSCKELPPSIIKRLPLRFTFDNNYYNSKYQGIPDEGYTKIFDSLLDGIEVRLNRPYSENVVNEIKPDIIIYSGCIDEYYNYKFGKLEYRSLKFTDRELLVKSFQGNAVFNYTSKNIACTRVTEHKFFNPKRYAEVDHTLITYEYPKKYTENDIPYYPIMTENNINLYNKYKELSEKETNVYFGGRLGQYKYFDMDKTIENAFELYNKIKDL